ncbi:DNA repair protein, putative [Hondaea fermentalgiana]|uniref:DNA repair protein, putative n=1 Tax=Hondaea fermentalgiana TaxID=2315210 RepID=A0A2R5GH43_9STRA|nr:DNA repair protein, putative [Hondaea fermentalgiana]|eukprot:GBG27963.1 DNA repair protein, putative [Hondaea fermentalgiana]
MRDSGDALYYEGCVYEKLRDLQGHAIPEVSAFGKDPYLELTALATSQREDTLAHLRRSRFEAYGGAKALCYKAAEALMKIHNASFTHGDIALRNMDVAERQLCASNKKRKVWDDGILLLEKNKAILYEMDGKVLGRTSYKHANEDALPEGCTLAVAGREVEVGTRVTVADFDSGRLFIGAKSTPLATSNPNLPLTSATAATGGARKPFKRVGLGAGPGRPGPSLSRTVAAASPLHPDTSPNALVLLRGDESKGTASTVVDPKLGKLLRPHQREGVQFLFDNIAKSKGAILADEMGLGKTLQCITLIWTVLRQGPRGATGDPWCHRVVVVTPSSLVKNWDAEFRKWLGIERIQPFAVSGTAKESLAIIEEFSRSKMRRVLIVSYESFRKHATTLNAIRGIDLVICDEGHRLKSASGNQTISALQGCKTRRRILLTGTPVQNDLAEFYAMVDFVAPSALGTDVRSFQRIFQTPIERGTDRGASADDRELAAARSKELQALTAGLILRRTAAVNERFLPPRTDVNVFVRLSPDQATSYQEYVRTHLYGSSSSASGTDALKLIHYLRQLCTHPRLVAEMQAASDRSTSSSSASSPSSAVGATSAESTLSPLTKTSAVNDAKVPLCFSPMVSAKFGLLENFLVQIRKAQPLDRIVLVSNSTKTLNLVEAMLDRRTYGFLRLDGSTTAADRQGLVNRFNAPYRGDPMQRGFPFAFLLSARAGGCGLNLVGASRLVLLDLDWNPATDQQAAARIWRDGQKSQVFIYRFIATGTIEERIFQRQEVKLNSAQGILHQGATTAKSGAASKSAKFSRAELKQLFEYNANTDCDTYDLMTKKATEEESKHLWQPYIGPLDIPDPAMRAAATELGNDVVTWVHAQSHKTSLALEDADKVAEESDDGDQSKDSPNRIESDLTSDSEHELDDAMSTSKTATGVDPDAVSAPRGRKKRRVLESPDHDNDDDYDFDF